MPECQVIRRVTWRMHNLELRIASRHGLAIERGCHSTAYLASRSGHEYFETESPASVRPTHSRRRCDRCERGSPIHALDHWVVRLPPPRRARVVLFRHRSKPGVGRERSEVQLPAPVIGPGFDACNGTIKDTFRADARKAAAKPSSDDFRLKNHDRAATRP